MQERGSIIYGLLTFFFIVLYYAKFSCDLSRNWISIPSRFVRRQDSLRVRVGTWQHIAHDSPDRNTLYTHLPLFFQKTKHVWIDSVFNLGH